MEGSELLQYLEGCANEALKNHTRLILLIMLNLLYDCSSKEEAIEKVADILEKI